MDNSQDKKNNDLDFFQIAEIISPVIEKYLENDSKKIDIEEKVILQQGKNAQTIRLFVGFILVSFVGFMFSLVFVENHSDKAFSVFTHACIFCIAFLCGCFWTKSKF